MTESITLRLEIHLHENISYRQGVTIASWFNALGPERAIFALWRYFNAPVSDNLSVIYMRGNVFFYI
ncbi:MAG: hypothetical protein OXD29_02775 [Roseovarius sp.]|nr:hypothetical protein [Roseovarius sp.]MCY4292084.1 hypothetical protein [Roseovarius sp.]